MIQTQTADIFQERLANRQTKKESHTERQKGRQTDRQRSIKGDRQKTYRQKTKGKTDKQTDRYGS